MSTVQGEWKAARWSRGQWRLLADGLRAQRQGGEARNAEPREHNLSAMDRFAITITNKVGSIGFFIAILAWTVLWCGYNVLASEVKSLHWRPFDLFPGFVAYLLVSNVIQLLLMPLIMVGQNLQGRHADQRAEMDFDINQKAEKEVMAVLKHLERNTDLLLALMNHLECQVSEDELRALKQEGKQTV